MEYDMETPQVIKEELPYGLIISLLGIYPKKKHLKELSVLPAKMHNDDVIGKSRASIHKLNNILHIYIYHNNYILIK